MTRTARLAGAFGFIAASAAGCLPRGEAPSGRQILADRTATLVQVIPPTGDGVLRVLFFRPGKSDQLFDLWFMSLDPGGAPPTERILFSDVEEGLVLGDRPFAQSPSTNFSGFGFGGPATSRGAFPTDAQGRIFVSRFVATSDLSTSGEQVVRIDPATGASRNLGPGYVTLSPSGQRVLLRSADQALLYEADDSMTTIVSQRLGFLGETVYYLTDDGDLMRSVPGGAVQQLATGVGDFNPANEQLILLTRDSSGSGPAATDPFAAPPAEPLTASILDTTTLQETPLPAGPTYRPTLSFSSDARWLYNVDQNFDNVIIDRLTGSVETFQATASSVFWRPGHAELWADDVTFDPNDPTAPPDTALWTKQPGQPIVTIPGSYATGFTPDGTYWITQRYPFSDRGAEELIGLADDPTGPLLPLVPASSSMTGLWPIDDAHLVTSAEVGLDAFEDDYVQMVNPATGTTTVIGQHGFLSAVGQTRLLGVFDASFERGDLTTFDFASGKTTVLAPEFARAAVVEAQGADLDPPGGRIVYQFGARFESPWDGLWLTTVP